MSRSLVFILLLFFTPLVACRHRPLQTCVRGDMEMNGKMEMEGEMTMRGDLNTKVAMVVDNRASLLKQVCVEGNASHMHAGKIAVIDVDGLLVNKSIGGLGSMGENPVALFREKLQVLEADTAISGLVLRINSAGGGVTAADIMAHDLRLFRQKRPMPVVACLMDIGAGAGYFLACEADFIVAHPTSLVGGIGVILNLYNLEDTMGQFNIVSLPIKSGKTIDLGSPERAMLPDEKQLLQNLAKNYHQRFIDQVSEKRPDVLSSPPLLDGRVMSASDAMNAKLVDRLGYLQDAILQVKLASGLSEGAAVVMLRRENDRAHTALESAPAGMPLNGILPLKVPGLDRSSLPTFLYMWQPEPTLASAS